MFVYSGCRGVAEGGRWEGGFIAGGGGGGLGVDMTLGDVIIGGDTPWLVSCGDNTPTSSRSNPPSLMFRATMSNSCDAFLVEKAYNPSPPGHFLPASNENMSLSQPYFLRYFRGHTHSSPDWVSLYFSSTWVTSINPFGNFRFSSWMFRTMKKFSGSFSVDKHAPITEEREKRGRERGGERGEE